MNFSWLGVNTSRFPNITVRLPSAEHISRNFSSFGGVMNESMWVDMNSFMLGNFTPIVYFQRSYRVFFHLSGTKENPSVSHINASCTAQLSNKPCYTYNATDSTVYLLTFSGVSGGSDNQSPQLTVNTPVAGATFTSSSVELGVTVSDNIAVERCFYSLDGGSNTSMTGCAAVTLSLGNGAHFLHIYVNDTSGNLNESQRSFIVDVPSEGASGGGGGSTGSSGGGGGGGRYGARTSKNITTYENRPPLSEEKKEQRSKSDLNNTIVVKKVNSTQTSSIKKTTTSAKQDVITTGVASAHETAGKISGGMIFDIMSLGAQGERFAPTVMTVLVLTLVAGSICVWWKYYPHSKRRVHHTPDRGRK